MISVISTKIESSSDQKDVVREVSDVSLNPDGRNDSSGGSELYSVRSSEKLERVSLASDNETRVSDTWDETSVSELKNGEASFGVERMEALEKNPISSHSNMQRNMQDVDLQNGDAKVSSVAHDYDSILSAFDVFAAKDKSDVVGYGYGIGDMVWGKVKSHPWWPGHIYNEQYATPSVRRSKREGHVLVAFFGDSSYGWFLPAELIPFEQNFAEKSRQTNLRSFSYAVEEAVDELSRRRSLGLACRCRNQFNFWPSSFENYFVVDVGDTSEPGLYSSSQINKARDSFQPRELLSFVQLLALNPRSQRPWSIELIKNKATFLAYRRSLFEEFDETYAQAFGTAPVRPPRPVAPAAIDPSKTPLSGRLVIAEALGKEESSLKPTKTKDQAEKDKYLFKRRDEPSPKKPKKTSSIQAGTTGQPFLVDGSRFSGRVLYSSSGDTTLQNHESNATDWRNHSQSQLASTVSEIKPVQSSSKLVESGMKKAKVHKRPLVKSSSEHAVLVENKKMKGKKEIKTDPSGNFAMLPSVVKTIEVSGMSPLRPPVSDNNQLDSQDSVVGSISSLVEPQQAVDFGNSKIPMLLKDLRCIALNPFHGSHRNCLANVQPVFLNFRSLVFQKSLSLTPTEYEASEVSASLPPASGNFVGGVDENSGLLTKKSVKPAASLDDPTKSGIKRIPLDQTKAVKKKRKLVDSEGIKKNFSDLEDARKKKFGDPGVIRKKKPMDDGELMKKKTSESEEVKKMKNTDDSKSFAVVKKPFQRGDVKENVAKNASPSLSRELRLQQSSKKAENPSKTPNPTMLVMKFPSGAGLPSGAQLRARFARFGPMDHSATRVFWKTYTCRVVYHFKADAEEALKFINGSSNLFGNANVRCYLRDLLAEAAEAESAKIQKDELPSVSTSQSHNSAGDQRMTASQLLQQSVQLKSCLKKPATNDEGGNGGGLRGARVKFVFHGEENAPAEQIVSGNKNMANIASYPEVASSSSSSSYSLDDNSKNLPKFIPHSNNAPPSSSFHKFPSNIMPSTEQAPARFYPRQTMPSELISNDISHEMLNLLNKCSDVVNNLTMVLGYLPYQPL